MRITFIRDTFKHEGGPHVKGDTIECSEASADRWSKRGAAVPASEAPAKPKAIDSPPADKSIKAPPKDKSAKPADVSNK